MKKWNELPEDLRISEVKEYYDILQCHKISLLAKRIFDIIVAGILLILLFPVFLALSLMIKLDSQGPVIFKQVRITTYGRKFKIYKFRTMVNNADKRSEEHTSELQSLYS